MDKELIIQKTILEMNKPFRLSDLFEVLESKGITDKILILEKLNQLLNAGLILSSDVEYDSFLGPSIYNSSSYIRA